MTGSVNNENVSFEYTYSAKRQKEVEEIRKKYLPPKEDKLETLRRLDRETERPGTMAAIALGITGTLLLGVGMCCTMVWKGMLFIPGIIIGILGIVIISGGYPTYKKITGDERKKVADQILELSEELSLE